MPALAAENTTRRRRGCVDCPLRAEPAGARAAAAVAACTRLLTYYFLGDRSLATFAAFVFAALAGVAGVHGRGRHRDPPARRLSGRPDRAGGHAAMAPGLDQERNDFPGFFPGLDESLVKSLG